jgi:hypothetical protein
MSAVSASPHAAHRQTTLKSVEILPAACARSLVSTVIVMVGRPNVGCAALVSRGGGRVQRVSKFLLARALVFAPRRRLPASTPPCSLGFSSGRLPGQPLDRR